MCHFASGVVTRDGRILVGDLQSHEGIEAGWGLTPGEYREWELQDEGMGHLELRLEQGDDRAEWLSAFAAYSNRTELLASITEGRKYDWCYTFVGGGAVSIKAPKATYFYVYNCPGLTSVEAPKATDFRVYNCPKLKRRNGGD